VRLDLAKPVRTAIWRQQWALADRLIDAAQERLQAIEATLPPDARTRSDVGDGGGNP
jgi:hypothetical protein